MGERTWVHPRLSRAVSTAASAARTAATLLAWALVRLSNSSREMAWTFTNFSARATSRAARSAAVRACSSWAWARSRSEERRVGESGGVGGGGGIREHKESNQKE